MASSKVNVAEVKGSRSRSKSKSERKWGIRLRSEINSDSRSRAQIIRIRHSTNLITLYLYYTPPKKKAKGHAVGETVIMLAFQASGGGSTPPQRT